MAQFGRPDADYSNDTWVTTPLWSKVDEASADDGDEIQSSDDPFFDACELDLTAVTDPTSSTGHIFRYRHKHTTTGGGSAPTMNLQVSLVQGNSTIIATDNVSPTKDVWTTTSYTLSAAEANAITDYSALSLRLTANDTGGSRTFRIHVSWVELEVPNAGTAYTRTVTGSVTPTGALTTAVTYARVPTGTITPTGALSTVYTPAGGGAFFRTVVGSITPSGALTRALTMARTVAGVVTPTGALTTDATLARITTGALTPSGALTTDATLARIVTGSITPTGALSTVYSPAGLVTRTVTGSLTPSGALIAGIVPVCSGGPVESSSGWDLSGVSVGSGWLTHRGPSPAGTPGKRYARIAASRRTGDGVPDFLGTLSTADRATLTVAKGEKFHLRCWARYNVLIADPIHASTVMRLYVAGAGGGGPLTQTFYLPVPPVENQWTLTELTLTWPSADTGMGLAFAPDLFDLIADFSAAYRIMWDIDMVELYRCP